MYFMQRTQQNVNILSRNRNCGEIHTQMAVTKKFTVQHLRVGGGGYQIKHAWNLNERHWKLQT